MLVLVSCKETKDDMINRAVKLKKEGKCKEAIEINSKLITNNYKLQVPYYNRGLCYLEMKDYPKALADFNKIMSLQTVGNVIIIYNPDVPDASDEAKYQVPYDDALYARAQVLYGMDSIEHSYRDFDRLVYKSYEKSNCLLWQGIIWVRSGNNENACVKFNKAKEAATNESDQKEAETFIRDHCNK
jgi:tetratricopeptide (TPR) repeat protein